MHPDQRSGGKGLAANRKAMNAELSKLWKPIIERKPAPPDADEWKDVPDKLSQLKR